MVVIKELNWEAARGGRASHKSKHGALLKTYFFLPYKQHQSKLEDYFSSFSRPLSFMKLFSEAGELFKGNCIWDYRMISCFYIGLSQFLL